MSWSSAEIAVIEDAVRRAPSVHNTQPWRVGVDGDRVELIERTDTELPRHDPDGRDRTISCGAALTNLELAVRSFGRAPRIAVLPDPDRSEVVARITADGEHALAGPDAKRFAAIGDRRSRRTRFEGRPRPEDLEALADPGPGTELHLVDRGEQTVAVAAALEYAAGVFRDDHGYQREIVAWSPAFPDRSDEADTLPWAGLVRAGTHLPDQTKLAERLAREAVFVVLTPDDTRWDRIRAGATLERVWLTAVARGLAASVLTQPLQLPSVRTRLVTDLGLTGTAQALIRIGLAND